MINKNNNKKFGCFSIIFILIFYIEDLFYFIIMFLGE